MLVLGDPVDNCSTECSPAVGIISFFRKSAISSKVVPMFNLVQQK